MVDKGDPALSVPVYNGGLFLSDPEDQDESPEARAARFLNTTKVPDRFLARALDLLARDVDPKRHDGPPPAPTQGDHEDRPYIKKKAHMTTERDILQALKGLPTSALEQVKDFIVFLKETNGSQRPPLKQKALAKKQMEAIKKWAGTNLGPGFSGREHDEVLYECLTDQMSRCD